MQGSNVKPKEEKPKPPLIKAEVIDHFISLHMGENRYEVFRKGAIVDIEPVTFRNLERKGRVKAAEKAMEDRHPACLGEHASSVPGLPQKKGKRRAGSPSAESGRMPNLQTKTAPPAGDDAVPC